jgi:hypothetical protein
MTIAEALARSPVIEAARFAPVAFAAIYITAIHDHFFLDNDCLPWGSLVIFPWVGLQRAKVQEI